MNGTIQINATISSYTRFVVAVTEYTVINEARKLINSYGIDKSTITSCIFHPEKIYLPLEYL